MKLWQKSMLAALVIASSGLSLTLSAQDYVREDVKYSLADRMVRKLGRGICNTAFGALEFPITWYRVNFEEGGIAACSYGILKAVINVVVRECVGVVEVVTFPTPLPGCDDTAPNSPAWGYGPILQPEWVITPSQNKYNFVYPNQDPLP